MNKTSLYDKCVSCGCDTPYKRTDNIDIRMYYVECGGQLCKKCWDKIYGDNNGN